MISINQVLLLQEKVDSAVAKIQQLKAENDALRTKCSQLTNALSEKTELLSAFENDEKTIEDGILNALDRLNSIENAVLNQAGNKPESPAPSQEAPASVPQNEQAETQEEPAVQSEQLEQTPPPFTGEGVTAEEQTALQEAPAEEEQQDALFNGSEINFDSEDEIESDQPVDIF